MDERYDILRGTAEIPDPGAFLHTLRAIASTTGTRVVCLNADLIAGLAHAEAAVLHALRAYESGGMISNALEMEVLLYAAATRQCAVAMEFGVHRGHNRMYLCFIPPSRQAISMMGAYVRFVEEEWECIEGMRAERLMGLFSITPAELEAVGPGRFAELVVERVALLNVNK